MSKASPSAAQVSSVGGGSPVTIGRPPQRTSTSPLGARTTMTCAPDTALLSLRPGRSCMLVLSGSVVDAGVALGGRREKRALRGNRSPRGQLHGRQSTRRGRPCLVDVFHFDIGIAGLVLVSTCPR